MVQPNPVSSSTSIPTATPILKPNPTLKPRQQPQTTQSFQPLEYWKPPKAVHHIRAKSSRIFSPKKTTHSFTEIHDPEKIDIELARQELEAEEFFKSKSAGAGAGADMSFQTLGEMAGRRKTFANEHVMGYDREDTLRQPWWNVKSWGKKAWAIFTGVVVVILIIVIAVAVVVSRSNRYPTYTTQSYALAETCKSCSPFLVVYFQCLPTGCLFLLGEDGM